MPNQIHGILFNDDIGVYQIRSIRICGYSVNMIWDNNCGCLYGFLVVFWMFYFLLFCNGPAQRPAPTTFNFLLLFLAFTDN